jgi:enoyl-[acyl-carrier-protein] reductase (NADH)
MSVNQHMLMYKRIKEKENQVKTKTGEVKKKMNKFQYVVSKINKINRDELTYEMLEKYAEEAGVETEMLFEIFKESLRNNAIKEIKQKMEKDGGFSNYHELDLIAKKYGFTYSQIKDLL